MSRVPLGVLLGLVIGAVDVLLMLPLSFPDHRASFAGAFCARFALAFFAATVRLPLPPVVAGVVIVGLLTSGLAQLPGRVFFCGDSRGRSSRLDG